MKYKYELILYFILNDDVFYFDEQVDQISIVLINKINNNINEFIFSLKLIAANLRFKWNQLK